jgi:hypothetical protein
MANAINRNEKRPIQLLAEFSNGTYQNDTVSERDIHVPKRCGILLLMSHTWPDPLRIALSILLCLGISLVVYGVRRPNPPAVENPLDQIETERMLNRINSTKTYDVNPVEYSRTVQEMQRQTLMGNVLYACVYRYHRDTCLHYYITCGDQCRQLISPERYARMDKDFWELMRERGLFRENRSVGSSEMGFTRRFFLVGMILGIPDAMATYGGDNPSGRDNPDPATGPCKKPPGSEAEICKDSPNCLDGDRETDKKGKKGDDSADEAEKVGKGSGTTDDTHRDAGTVRDYTKEEGSDHHDAAKHYDDTAKGYRKSCERDGDEDCAEFRRKMAAYYDCLTQYHNAREANDILLGGLGGNPGADQIAQATGSGTGASNALGGDPTQQTSALDPASVSPSTATADPFAQSTADLSNPNGTVAQGSDAFQVADNNMDTSGNGGFTSYPVYPGQSQGCASLGAGYSCSGPAMAALGNGNGNAYSAPPSYPTYTPKPTTGTIAPASAFQTASLQPQSAGAGAGTAAPPKPADSAYSATLARMTAAPIYQASSIGKGRSAAYEPSSYTPSSVRGRTVASAAPTSSKPLGIGGNAPQSLNGTSSSHSRGPASMGPAQRLGAQVGGPVTAPVKVWATTRKPYELPAFNVFAKIEVHSISNETLLKGIPFFSFHNAK